MGSSRGTDGTYNYRRWDEEPPVWSYTGPFASRQEELTQQALTAAFMTAEEVGNYVVNPLRQVQVFRPRFGYLPYNERQSMIEDVVGVSRRVTHVAGTWYSGTAAGMLGGSRYSSNSLGLA